jgi:hypothetical protein
MRKTIIAFAIIITPAMALAQAKPKLGPCAGLAQDACGAKAECAWQPAITKGEKSPSTGKEYKISRKAYCRKKPGSVPVPAK